MATSQSIRNRKKPAALKVALAVIIPLVVVLWSTMGTMVLVERYGMGLAPSVLFAWCVVLLGAAAWLNYALFDGWKTFLPLAFAIVSILAIWIWQRHEFMVYVPSAGLSYGYFLEPAGAKARVWVLTFPLRVALALLSVCCIASIRLGWRAGGRSSLLCMIPWWLATFLVFTLPSMYLDGQGNASIFI